MAARAGGISPADYLGSGGVIQEVMHPSATECLRNILDDAQRRARRRNYDFVGTEHLLLALLTAKSGQAALILRKEHQPLDAMRATLEKQLAAAAKPTRVEGNLPLSSKAQKTLNNAIVLSQSLRETRVTTRHLLMSLLNDGSSNFLTMLGRVGGDPDSFIRSLAVVPSDAES